MLSSVRVRLHQLRATRSRSASASSTSCSRYFSFGTRDLCLSARCGLYSDVADGDTSRAALDRMEP
jgi:hypothetical protein